MERKERSRLQKDYEKLEKQMVEIELTKKNDLQKLQTEYENVQRNLRVYEEEKNML